MRYKEAISRKRRLKYLRKIRSIRGQVNHMSNVPRISLLKAFPKVNEVTVLSHGSTINIRVRILDRHIFEITDSFAYEKAGIKICDMLYDNYISEVSNGKFKKNYKAAIRKMAAIY